MAKKEIITLTQIEQDIIHSLKEPQEMSKSTYKKWRIPCAIIGGLLVVVSIFYPTIGVYSLLILLVAGCAGGAIEYLLLRRKRKNVCIVDYDVTTEVLSNKVEESYSAPAGKHRSRTVTNYTLFFENGEGWRIPQDNYLWSEERPMSDFYIYQNSHRGDAFIVVIKKDTGKIAMAYDTEFFKYKEG